MPVSGTRNDENGLELVSDDAEAAAGLQADAHWSDRARFGVWSGCRHVPGIVAPAIGEHVEQSVLPFGIPRRPASVEEVRHGHDLF